MLLQDNRVIVGKTLIAEGHETLTILLQMKGWGS